MAATSSPGSRKKILIVLAIIVVVIAGVSFLFESGAFTQHHSQVVATGYAVIPSGYFRNASFTVPAGVSNAVVSGTVTASGDFNNQVTVYIMTQTDFETWAQGGQVAPVYSSGQVAGATLDVPLPAGNTYDLVFYNTFTLAASTVVTGQLTLTYDS